MKQSLPLGLAALLLWSGRLFTTQAAAISDTTNALQFRFPAIATYHFDATPDLATANPMWLRAQPANGSTNYVEFGSRVVVQLRNSKDLQRLTAGSALQLSRKVTENVFILQAPDAATAVREAARLATLPEVAASYPVVKQEFGLHSPYAYQPSALYFGLYQSCFGQYYNFGQYYFENRNPLTGERWGTDINIRGAWPYTRGAGVTVAVVDGGYETDHPNLSLAANGAPHFNFETGTTNGNPPTTSYLHNHGTAVAGFIAAQSSNPLSTLGAAPNAKLASWVIFGTNDTIVSDDVLMDAYEYRSDSVAIQNHSWGQPNGGVALFPETLLESIGISNAVTSGRGEHGVIMTRSSGNNRAGGGNANDDAHCSDPYVMGVTSVRVNGRAANNSSPGASILLATVGGQSGEAYELTTDRQGSLGYNGIGLLCPVPDPNFGNYCLFFYGTSAAAPQVAGIAALMLAVNPNLTYRDVQQILLLSARHFDLADSDLRTNGAGFVVSHNVGFGIPDAGEAVRLASGWGNLPALITMTLTTTNPLVIPDDGLRVNVSGNDVPVELASIKCLPGTGPHVETQTAALPLVDAGLATNTISVNLTNKAALIQRGTNSFEQKINFVAQAGAAFAVIYNYSTNVASDGGDQLTIMGGTDFTPIPAVFIGNSDGESLKSFFATNSGALAEISLNSTSHVFAVTNTLLCEHVGLRVQSDHALRGDLRITLMSPSGTRSVLQAYNADTNAGPADWTYWSTHHFFEGSMGDWTAYFADEGGEPGATGSVQQVTLIVQGTGITDTDGDGLDDNWEQVNFGSLAQGPQDDPDNDGYNNAREQVMRTDPNIMDVPFRLDLTPWNTRLARLSWPGSEHFTYQVWQGTNAAAPLTLATNLPGLFPETEWFTPYTNASQQFFRVQAIPQP